MCPGASEPSAAGATSRISAAAWSRSSAALLSSRFSAAGAAAQVPLAQPRAERGAVAAHAPTTVYDGGAPAAATGVAPAAPGFEPLPPASSATMSRMMREMSKSFGV